MNNLDIKIKMLETLYNLADKGKINSLKNFGKYVVAINNDMLGLLEYKVYQNAIDKIFLAATSFEVDDLYYAKESVNKYKRIADYLSKEDLFEG